MSNTHPTSSGTVTTDPIDHEIVRVLAGTLDQVLARLPGHERLRVAPAAWAEWVDRFQLQGHRLLVVEFGERSVYASLLSLFFGSVDLAHFDQSRLNLTRYISGEATKSASYRTDSQRRAGASTTISLFCEEEQPDLGEVSLVLLVAPESVPRASQEIVDLVDAPYIAVAEDPRYEYSMLRFWVGASSVYLKTTSIQHEWKTAHLLPARPLTLADPEAVLAALSDAVVPPPSAAVMSGAGDAHRVLLISYFAPPTTPVSVQRLRYWHENLGSLARGRGRRMDVYWLSATRAASGDDHMLVVPDRGELHMSDAGWEFVEELRRLELDRLGASWSDAVRQESPSWDRFDTVVMSGNPFYYFGLTSFFKELWGAKVVLDFRDPFAWNPRFNYTLDQRAFLMELEEEMVEPADAVVSVNLECLNEISPAIEVPRRIVANGFDEEMVGPQVDRSDRTGEVRLVYSGTVFRNLPLDDLLDALPKGRMLLEHYGRDYSLSQAVSQHPSGRSRGLVPYRELVRSIRSADAGVVMTSGESSTQTTKLFDYIACDLDIIIVTGGEPETGNLHEVTRELDGVFWVKNSAQDLKAFFSTYTPTGVTRPERDRFSRRYQTEQLLELILELEGS